MADGADTELPQDEPEAGETSPPRKDYRLHSYPSSGPFVIPAENTWAAHNHYLKATQGEMGFNPERYAYFDAIIAKKLNNPALTDPKHEGYARLDAMRGNIAVIRNFVLGHYEQTGEFKEGARPQIERIESIAESLGQALSNDKWGTRAFTRSTSMDVANIDGVGAMEMYKYLLEIQETPTVRQPMLASLKSFLALTNRDWALPQLAESPFHPAALAAPPPGYVSTPLPKPDTTSDTYDADAQSRDLETKAETKAPETKEQQAPAASAEKDAITESIEITEQAVKTANNLQSIDTLAEVPRDESVEEARKILRNLRNMEFNDRSMEEFLDQGTPSAIVAKKQSFARLIDIFSAHLKNAQNGNPHLAQANAAVEQARDTSATIALEMAEHTRRMLREDDERERRLNQLIDSLPKEADLRITLPVERLLETLELGLETVSGRELAHSSLERLMLSSERMEHHAVLMNEALRGQEAAREESIELARSVLLRLQQVPYGDQTLQEFIETAKPREQAAFAQQIEELSGMYHNLALEAAQTNPEIVQDNRITEGANTVKGFAHAVKLMAAKELPNSIASAQQISAADSGAPENWNDLSKQTVNRLVKTAEASLEKALGVMAQSEEDQEEDIAQEMVEAALTQSDTSKRKKKRRGGDAKPRSGKGAKKQKKKMLDINADDYSLKQGRFAEESKDMRKESHVAGSSIAGTKVVKTQQKQTQNRAVLDADDRLQGTGRFADQSPIMGMSSRATTINTSAKNPNAPKISAPKGLKDTDLAAIQQLGGSLRNIGNQMASVTGTEKLPPDNRTPAQNDPLNPRNRKGPDRAN